MLIYVLIAAELGLLYTVFWYFYVREPKPFKIVGNPWGKYGETGFTTGGIDPTLPFEIRPQEEIPGWLDSSSQDQSDAEAVNVAMRMPVERPRRIQLRRHRCKRSSSADPPALGLSKTPTAINNQSHAAPILLRLLCLFSRTIDGLNVRVP